MYITARVDIDDIWDEISDEQLLKECRSRKLETSVYAIPYREARQSCIDAADVLRKIGRIDLSHRLDEIKTDYLS